MPNTQLTMIQPKHSYAEKEGMGHIHLSSPLLSATARIEMAGVLSRQKNLNTTYFDENLQNIAYNELQGIVGMNLVGAPYIPVVLEKIQQIPNDVSVILWGQIVSSLTTQEFDTVFRKNRENIFNGNENRILETLLALPENALPRMEEVDMTVAYSHIPDEQMKQYLTKEFSIYLSQGCKYNCQFCQACKNRKEKYRDLSLLEKELVFLGEKAEKFWISTISFYLSNLDILQTPEMFEKFLDILERVEQQLPNVKFSFRGLCGIESFLNVYGTKKEMLERAKKLWLSSIGYGVDGATAEVWKSIGKFQNYKKEDTEWEQDKAIETIRNTYELWITPEALMVFWHPWETNESLESAYNFCKDMFELYGATPRPHVAKHIIPGAKGRYQEENKELVNRFIENPEYFQALDYTALPSELTHPDEKFRALVAKWYMKICALTPNATQYIIPNTPEYQRKAQEEWTTVEKMNEGKFDR